jgi:CpeT protein
MKRILLTAVIIVSAFSVYAQKKIRKNDLEKLFHMMSGSFSSEAQAFRDTNYYDIRLQMKPIWGNLKNGYWFYVEQAMAKSMNKPYRQRVYHLYKLNDTCIVSQVYNLKDPLRFAGEFKKDNPLEHLTMDSLETKEGCAIYLLKKKKDHFSGSTPGKQCSSNLRGATYATSEVTVVNGMLISWDRGFDENDKQVWGATNGGYMFIKIKNW